jgi:hypothetical protein
MAGLDAVEVRLQQHDLVPGGLDGVDDVAPVGA